MLVFGLMNILKDLSYRISVPSDVIILMIMKDCFRNSAFSLCLLRLSVAKKLDKTFY